MTRPARRALRALPLAALLVFLCPSRATAEWQVVPFFGYTFKGATTLIDLERGVETTHWHLGGLLRAVGDGPFGLEGLFLHTPGFFERSEDELAAENLVTSVRESRTYALMGNVVLTAPRRWNEYGLRPYVSGGIGRMHVQSVDLNAAFPLRLDLLGMNVGGGGVGFVSDRIGLRFDLRYFRNVRGVDQTATEVPVTILGEPVRLRYWTGNVGVVIGF